MHSLPLTAATFTQKTLYLIELIMGRPVQSTVHCFKAKALTVLVKNGSVAVTSERKLCRSLISS